MKAGEMFKSKLMFHIAFVVIQLVCPSFLPSYAAVPVSPLYLPTNKPPLRAPYGLSRRSNVGVMLAPLPLGLVPQLDHGRLPEI